MIPSLYVIRLLGKQSVTFVELAGDSQTNNIRSSNAIES